mmetsp:Transcript_117971/g.376113  ORF Transcript_117971/g.376113 Transcript_117971/m.376113 type:complete len:319 (-) Transcript_117971:129-1085(-)
MGYDQLRRLGGNLLQPLHILQRHGRRRQALAPIRAGEILGVSGQRFRAAELVGKVQVLHQRVLATSIKRFLHGLVHIIQVGHHLGVDVARHLPLDELSDEVHGLRGLVRLRGAQLQLPGQPLSVLVLNRRHGARPKGRRRRPRGRRRRRGGGCGGGGFGRGRRGRRLLRVVAVVDDLPPGPALQRQPQGHASRGHAILEGARGLEDGAISTNRLLRVLRRLVHHLQHLHQRRVRGAAQAANLPLHTGRLTSVRRGQLLELMPQRLHVPHLLEGAAGVEGRADAGLNRPLALQPLHQCIAVGIWTTIGEGWTSLRDSVL